MHKPLGAGEPHTLTTHEQALLATNPLFYWSLYETDGSVIHDLTGNGYHGASIDVLLAQTGLFGANCIQFMGRNASRLNPNNALSAAMNMNEYSIAARVKVNVNAGVQVRVFNTYSSNFTEYSALEIRSGDEIGLFLKEGGVEQNIAAAQLPAAEDEVWVHMVIFNSLSAGKFGMYYNGTKYEFDKTLAGATNPVTPTTPELFNYLDGWAQDVVGYDHALSQAEVDILLAA